MDTKVCCLYFEPPKKKKSRKNVVPIDKTNKLGIEIDWVKPVPAPPKKRGPKSATTKETYVPESSWNSNIGKYAISGPGIHTGSVPCFITTLCGSSC